MEVNTFRALLFLTLCIGLRFIFVLLSAYADIYTLRLMGALALIPAFGFTTIYIFNLRQTGAETFGGKIWWNHLRPLHSALYFIFSFSTVFSPNISWIPLLIDVLIGLLSWFQHRILASL